MEKKGKKRRKHERKPDVWKDLFWTNRQKYKDKRESWQKNVYRRL